MGKKLDDLLIAYYKKAWNIPEKVTRVLFDYAILVACEHGKGIKTIARELETTEDDIKQVLDTYLGFPGWEDDLDLDPAVLYERFPYKKYMYYSEFRRISPATAKGIIWTSYEVCEKIIKLRKVLDTYER